ncbi:MAG: glycosyltransferase [Acetobacteraceae bacterium]|nr:glycosyltransferase [Acetobacteraceae bacterium]
MKALPLVPGRYVARLPAAMQGRWYLALVRLPIRPASPVLRLRFMLADEAAFSDEVFFFPLPFQAKLGRHWATASLPAEASSIYLDLFGITEPPPSLVIHLITLWRPVAGFLLATGRSRLLLAALRGAGPRRLGMIQRVRSAFSLLATSTRPPISYLQWIALFDTWSSARGDALLASPRRRLWPDITVLLFETGADAPLQASIASLKAQIAPAPYRVIDHPAALGNAAAETGTEYVALLQAGEVLARHALALLADQVAAAERPQAVYADEDRVSPVGERHSPLFKPEPNHLLMLSGTLVRGIWLIRREVLLRYPEAAADWAETLRLDLWLRLYQDQAAVHSRRIPYVLTHRRDDAEAAPPEALAAVVRRHIARSGFGMQVAPSYPLELRVSAPLGASMKVGIIVPTACRSPQTLKCLSAVLASTASVEFELLLVISQTAPLEKSQQAIIEQICRDHRARYVISATEHFNYAQANNFGAQQMKSELICLLNDDVAPLSEEWLSVMVGHLSDPRVGVVGAKLIYPNETV